jgi:hypothetical protein
MRATRKGWTQSRKGSTSCRVRSPTGTVILRLDTRWKKNYCQAAFRFVLVIGNVNFFADSRSYHQEHKRRLITQTRLES